MFTKQDKRSYAQFLRSEIRNQWKQQRTIAREYNILNLSKDLKNLENESA